MAISEGNYEEFSICCVATLGEIHGGHAKTGMLIGVAMKSAVAQAIREQEGVTL